MDRRGEVLPAAAVAGLRWPGWGGRRAGASPAAGGGARVRGGWLRRRLVHWRRPGGRRLGTGGSVSGAVGGGWGPAVRAAGGRPRLGRRRFGRPGLSRGRSLGRGVSGAGGSWRPGLRAPALARHREPGRNGRGSGPRAWRATGVTAAGATRAAAAVPATERPSGRARAAPPTAAATSGRGSSACVSFGDRAARSRAANRQTLHEGR